MAGQQTLEYIADTNSGQENENSFADSYVAFVEKFRQNFNYGKTREYTMKAVACGGIGGLVLYLKNALGTAGAVYSAYDVCGKIALAVGGIFGLIATLGFLYSAHKNKKNKTREK